MYNNMFTAINTELDAVEDVATKAYLIRGIVSSINGSAIGVAIQLCRQLDKQEKSVDGFNALINEHSSGTGIPEFGPPNRDPMTTIRSLMFIKERLLDMGNFQDKLRTAIDTPSDTFDYIANQTVNADGIKAMVDALKIEAKLMEKAVTESREANRQYLTINKDRILEMLKDYEYDYEVDIDECFNKLPPRTVGKLLLSLNRGFEKAVTNCMKAAMNYGRINRLTEVPLFQSCIKAVKTVENQLPEDIQAAMLGL